MNHNLFKSFKAAVLLIAGLLALLQLQTANAFEYDLSGRNYNAPEARQYQRIRVGVIDDIRITETTRDHPNGGYAGAALGALVGGLVGQLAGQGQGRYVAAAIGGTAGGIGGKMAGDYVARERKVTAEIIVTLNDGNTVAIVQEVDQDTAQLRPNDKVRLIEGQAIRVVKFRTAAAPATY